MKETKMKNIERRTKTRNYKLRTLVVLKSSKIYEWHRKSISNKWKMEFETTPDNKLRFKGWVLK